MTKIDYILTNIEDPDCGHILRLLECETGKIVEGRVTGGESNIREIMSNWDGEGTGWSEHFYFQTIEMKRREFNTLWKNLPYAGCERKDLQNFIRESLSKMEEE